MCGEKKVQSIEVEVFDDFKWILLTILVHFSIVLLLKKVYLKQNKWDVYYEIPKTQLVVMSSSRAGSLFCKICKLFPF